MAQADGQESNVVGAKFAGQERTGRQRQSELPDLRFLNCLPQAYYAPPQLGRCNQIARFRRETPLICNRPDKSVGIEQEFHSLPEKIFQLLRKRIVEVIGDDNFPLGGAELEAAICLLDGDEFGDGGSGLGDDDLFAHGDALEQAGKVSFGLVDINFHGGIIA